MDTKSSLDSTPSRDVEGRYRPVFVFSSVFLCAFALSACHYFKPLRVIPEENPSPVTPDVQRASAYLRNFFSDHGTILLKLPSGEKCTGKWSTKKRRFAGNSSESLLNMMGPIASKSASIVGSDTTSRNGQATLYCWHGSTVNMDFVTRKGTSHGYGMARDSSGRHYLIDFRW